MAWLSSHRIRHITYISLKAKRHNHYLAVHPTCPFINRSQNNIVTQQIIKPHHIPSNRIYFSA